MNQSTINGWFIAIAGNRLLPPAPISLPTYVKPSVRKRSFKHYLKALLHLRPEGQFNLTILNLGAEICAQILRHRQWEKLIMLMTRKNFLTACYSTNTLPALAQEMKFLSQVKFNALVFVISEAYKLSRR